MAFAFATEQSLHRSDAPEGLVTVRQGDGVQVPVRIFVHGVQG